MENVKNIPKQSRFQKRCQDTKDLRFSGKKRFLNLKNSLIAINFKIPPIVKLNFSIPDNNSKKPEMQQTKNLDQLADATPLHTETRLPDRVIRIREKIT